MILEVIALLLNMLPIPAGPPKQDRRCKECPASGCDWHLHPCQMYVLPGISEVRCGCRGLTT